MLPLNIFGYFEDIYIHRAGEVQLKIKKPQLNVHIHMQSNEVSAT